MSHKIEESIRAAAPLLAGAVADVASAAPSSGSGAPISRLSAARLATREFLSRELGAREVRITKIVPVEHGSGGWSAEAEILVPNFEVKMLNLPLTQEVLERECYTIELDADFAVTSYEHLEASED